MIRQYDKKDELQLSLHFKLSEFHCRCTDPSCVATWVDEYLIGALEELHALIDTLIVNDGYRCRRHNEAVGGMPNSFHCLGQAADIRSPIKNVTELSRSAKRILGFSNGGIGEYRTFLHVDVRGNGPARWMR